MDKRLKFRSIQFPSLKALCCRVIDPNPVAMLTPGPVLHTIDVVWTLQFAGRVKLHFQNPDNPPIMVGIFHLEAVLNDDVLEVLKNIIREGMGEVQLKNITFWTVDNDWQAVKYNISNISIDHRGRLRC